MKKRKINWWKLLFFVTLPVWILPALAFAIIALGLFEIWSTCLAFYRAVTDEVDVLDDT